MVHSEVKNIISDASARLWVQQEYREKGYKHAKKLAERIIPLLSTELGRLHNTHETKKFWEPIIGPWVREFSVIYVDRTRVYNN